MSEVKESMDKENVTGGSKGERLRLAREALGWEATEAAAKLHFETRFIVALENDDHSIFAGSAYLYGYMRAYVRLLGLPLDEFVQNLKNIEDEDEHESHFEHIRYEAATVTKSQQWMWPAIISFLLVLVAVIAWLVMRDDVAETDSISSWTTPDTHEMRSIPVPLLDDDRVAATFQE